MRRRLKELSSIYTKSVYILKNLYIETGVYTINMQFQKFFYQKFCRAIEPHTYAMPKKYRNIYLQSLLIGVLYTPGAIIYFRAQFKTDDTLKCRLPAAISDIFTHCKLIRSL
jgi:hypothetical protein